MNTTTPEKNIRDEIAGEIKNIRLELSEVMNRLDYVMREMALFKSTFQTNLDLTEVEMNKLMLFLQAMNGNNLTGYIHWFHRVGNRYFTDEQKEAYKSEVLTLVAHAKKVVP